MELGNSTRSVPKATYVPLKLDEGSNDSGRALQKASYLKLLALQEGEVNRIISPDQPRRLLTAEPSSERLRGKSITSNDVHKLGDLRVLLLAFEGKDIRWIVPNLAAVATAPATQLLDFGERVANQRQIEADQANNVDREKFAQLNLVVQKTRAANVAFSSVIATSQVGMLNLERIDMTPAGIERGELIATIPLAPREKTNVTQHEWSTISSEFTSIVTDSLENYSETGVEENTELSQATTSQNSHANQFNVTASVSGGIGFVTGSATTSFGSQSQGSTSASDSSKHAQSVTKKASSRVTQSRKVTISTSSASGASSSTSRTLQNPSDTEPMRIDYFGMMRKWHVGLYRYGLRLTYDITVPEPGATLRQIYSDIDVAKTNLAQKFKFDLDPNELAEGTYIQIAARYDVNSPTAPPTPSIPQQLSGIIPNLKRDNDTDWIQNEISFTVKDGYEIEHIEVQLILSNWEPDTDNNPAQARVFRIVGSKVDASLVGPFKDTHPQPVNLGDYLKGQGGTLKIVFFNQYFGHGTYDFTVFQVPSVAKMDEWRSILYQRLYDSALTEFTAHQTLLQSKLEELSSRISGIDTLTLRREENDEIMKCVLRWLFPAWWQFVKPDIASAFANDTQSADEAPAAHGIHFSDNDALKDEVWMAMKANGREVSFINQAIEWENVVYFLYSYFWDDPASWKFIHNLQHPDPTRQAFLRAGSARVVLTVRKGFEKAFAWFVDRATLDGMPTDISNYPYLRIAQEIENYDTTNYPGIPPANPAGTVNIGGQYAGTMAMSSVEPGDEVSIRVQDASDFQVGNMAVIDKYESKVQERQKIVKVNTDRNILTLERMDNKHSADKKPYPVYQSGEQGLLISEWYEYTPSHGTMIGINSTLNDMA